MSNRMKSIVLAATILAGLAACQPETSQPCKMVAPDAYSPNSELPAGAQYDGRGNQVGIWMVDSETFGYAVVEDSTIWETSECALTSARYL